MPRYENGRDSRFQEMLKKSQEVAGQGVPVPETVLIENSGLTKEQSFLIYQIFSELAEAGMVFEKSKKLPSAADVAEKLVALNLCEEAKGSNVKGLTLRIGNGQGKEPTIFVGRLGTFVAAYFRHKK